MLFPYVGAVLNESAPVDSLTEKSDASAPPASDQKIDFPPGTLPVFEKVCTAELFSAKEKDVLLTPALPLGPLIRIFCPFRGLALPISATISVGWARL